MRMVFHCCTHPTFTLLSIPTRPKPFAARSLSQNLPDFAAVVPNTDPPNSKRRVASHKQCHGLVHMERKCFPGAIVDCVLGTAGRRTCFNRCESQMHHLVPERMHLTSPGRCDAYRTMDRTMEQDHRNGQPPNTLLTPAGLKYLRLFFREICCSPLDIVSPLKGPALGTLIPSATTGRDMPLIRIFIKHAYAEWITIWVNIASTPLCDETRSTWYMVITRLHNINTQNKRACVQFISIKTLLHRHTTSTATSNMSVDTSQDCCGTANGPQICYVSPQWLVLHDVTTWPKTKLHTIIWLTGNYVNHVLQNGSSVTLHDLH